MIKQLGGVFVRSKNAEALANWYKKILLMALTYSDEAKCWWVSWNYFNDDDSVSYTNFAIMQKDELLPSNTHTINLQVENMNATLLHLKKNNVVYKGPEKYNEGWFAWIDDADGNKIELWEDTQALEH